jgi:hypothetical protein
MCSENEDALQDQFQLKYSKQLSSRLPFDVLTKSSIFASLSSCRLNGTSIQRHLVKLPKTSLRFS